MHKDLIKRYKKSIESVVNQNPSKSELEEKLSELLESAKSCKEITQELYFTIAVYLTVYRAICTEFK